MAGTNGKVKAAADFGVAFGGREFMVCSMMVRNTYGCFAVALWLGFWVPVASGESGGWSLGDPPQPPTPDWVLSLKRSGLSRLSQTGPFVVDTASREQVRLFHQAVYVASDDADMAWTGDTAACQAGTTSFEYQNAVVRRINYFRALAGVPAGVNLDLTYNAEAQEAALMMSANNALNHFPPVSWSCYTASGADAARNSNLAIGRVGPAAIDGYIEDFGAGNGAVGHRRWLLYPQTQTMGTGDVPPTGPLRAANAVWVFDANYGGVRPATRTPYVSWPPEGYVPYQTVYPRWSFSYAGASFGTATVTLSSDGVSVPVTVEPISANTGENTLVWYPSHLNPNSPYTWPRPESDTPYEVTIRNVLVAGVARDFNYQVVVFDPSTPGAETVLPEIDGPAQPAAEQPNAYNLSGVPGADTHQYRVSRRVPFLTVDGAEDGLVRFAASVSPGYEVTVTNPKASGSWAFHLAHPVLTPQYLTYLPVLVPNQNARLEFRSRLGWATANQLARVQVLVGGVGVWQDIYAQPGSGGFGEESFVLRSIPLASLAGRSLQIRFAYDGSTGSYYPGADPGVGWYLDDIAIREAEELLDSALSAPFSGDAFTWNPPGAGDYALEVRAQVFGDYHAEWGIVYPVTAVVATLPPVLRFVGSPTIAAGQIALEFEVDHYRSGLSFELLRADSPELGWTVDGSAAFETVTPNSQFRVRSLLGGPSSSGYFRLRAN
jgi:hypothetical protein